MLDKQGVAVDTVFCPTSIYVANRENSKNINFSVWGYRNT